jgi:hypothetical protein
MADIITSPDVNRKIQVFTQARMILASIPMERQEAYVMNFSHGADHSGELPNGLHTLLITRLGTFYLISEKCPDSTVLY